VVSGWVDGKVEVGGDVISGAEVEVSGVCVVVVVSGSMVVSISGGWVCGSGALVGTSILSIWSANKAGRFLMKRFWLSLVLISGMFFGKLTGGDSVVVVEETSVCFRLSRNCSMSAIIFGFLISQSCPSPINLPPISVLLIASRIAI